MDCIVGGTSGSAEGHFSTGRIKELDEQASVRSWRGDGWMTSLPSLKLREDGRFVRVVEVGKLPRRLRRGLLCFLLPFILAEL